MYSECNITRISDACVFISHVVMRIRCTCKLKTEKEQTQGRVQPENDFEDLKNSPPLELDLGGGLGNKLLVVWLLTITKARRSQDKLLSAAITCMDE